jgi:hypothetical protein
VHDAPGWKAVHLDDVEAVPWLGTELTWRPVRQTLGAKIVGIAAFTAERAGQEVVEVHSEVVDGRGHEEVYVVLRGRVRFTLDGARCDAPGATFVVVAPAVHRHAVAIEPGTAVLALGGPATYEPSASEWIERARPYIRSDPARARRILDELRAARPGSPGIEIGVALLALGQSDVETARATIAELLADQPALADQVAGDRDLGPLVAACP